MKVRDKEPEDQPWIEKILSERWRGVQVIVHNEIFEAHLLPALVAVEKDGLATFRIQQTNRGKFAELMTLDAVTANQGVGTALVEVLISRLRVEFVTALRVTTTNDNLNALRFYQRRAFRITEVRPGAVNSDRLSNRTVDVIARFRQLVSGGPGMISRSDLTRLTKLLQRFKSGGAVQVEIGSCPDVSQRVNVSPR